MPPDPEIADQPCQAVAGQMRLAALLILLVLVSLFSACAARTRIHVFSLGVPDTEVQRLTGVLQQQGFAVYPNSLPVPASIVRNTIVFPAIVQDFATVESVRSAMTASGFADARLIREAQANHFYSTDNIGIYLVNTEGIDILDSPDIHPYALGGEAAGKYTNLYYSVCAPDSEKQSELSLYTAGTALLERFIWDEESSEEISAISDGEWSQNGDSIRVIFSDTDEEMLQFVVQEANGEDRFGPYSELTLINQNPESTPGRCDYRYRDYDF